MNKVVLIAFSMELDKLILKFKFKKLNNSYENSE